MVSLYYIFLLWLESNIWQVSSVELERACLKFLPSEILECAAVAVPQKGGGPDSLVIFVVLKGTRNDSDSKLLLSGCQKAIRTDINPLFKVSKVNPFPLQIEASWSNYFEYTIDTLYMV